MGTGLWIRVLDKDLIKFRVRLTRSDNGCKEKQGQRDAEGNSDVARSQVVSFLLVAQVSRGEPSTR